MVIGMANMRKVTVTLPTKAIGVIRDLVASGKADSVSGFVQHAVQVSIHDIAGWSVMLAQALRETGGDLTPQERAWAGDVLGLSSVVA